MSKYEVSRSVVIKNITSDEQFEELCNQLAVGLKNNLEEHKYSTEMEFDEDVPLLDELKFYVTQENEDRKTSAFIESNLEPMHLVSYNERTYHMQVGILDACLKDIDF